jgi:hypothetical protein
VQLILVEPGDKSVLAESLQEQSATEYHQSLGELSNIELPEDTIVINAAGKEGATDESWLVQSLASKAGQSKVFVDIRPHLDIAVVERAKGLGWQAHTGLGMNARNDHALVTGITNYLRVPTPSFRADSNNLHPRHHERWSSSSRGQR